MLPRGNGYVVFSSKGKVGTGSMTCVTANPVYHHASCATANLPVLRTATIQQGHWHHNSRQLPCIDQASTSDLLSRPHRKMDDKAVGLGISAQDDSGQYWPGMEKLNRVQELLEQNKLLITEINQNHELKTPDPLQRNNILIRQLNANISDVLRHYNELSSLVVDTSQGQKGPASAG